MNLSSLAGISWRFRELSTLTWLPATVPGCVHTDLLAAGKIPDPYFGSNERTLQWIGERDWEYQASFSVSAAILADEVIDLAADGLDTVATVYLNKIEIGQTENMFIGHRWPVHSLLRVGRNELRLVFHSAIRYVQNTRMDFTPPREFCDPVGNAVRIRKQPSQFGWDWAPRLVTAGIWRDIRLERWNRNRLTHFHLAQNHRPNGSVELVIAPEFERPESDAQITAVCLLQGIEVARATGSAPSLSFDIAQPQLWWPAGQGSQPLYHLVVQAHDSSGREIGRLERRVGLRRVELDRHADEWGETFQIVVNGRAIFVKGANWIPAHSFVASLTRQNYERDLSSAVEANMNCLRLWGGGIYESEHFYDLCDEMGLLVWHDFMFSCALYPADEKFLQSVRVEATQQIKRLQHRTCIALWCGNNELAQLNTKSLLADAQLMAGYQALFHELLPAIVAACDGTRSYWPTSEWRGSFESGHALGEKSGDSHYWDVWHARHPVKDYEKWAFRFCSEFGMQSYSSPATNATFCPAGDGNVFGPAMENHQKNAQGNQVILDYVSRRYRFPKEQHHLPYLSQLNQAYCMQVGVEHYRRLMPRCMGALYWQLNDCWPATSWSSIEFNGRWKALNHAARRFNAPALATAHVPGDETLAIGNNLTSTVDEVHLYTVYDAPSSRPGLLRWDLFHLDGRILLSGHKQVRLRFGESTRQKTLRLAKFIALHGSECLYLRIGLECDGTSVSQQTVFLTAPRFMSLPQAPVRVSIAMESRLLARISFLSPCFQHALSFELPGLPHRSDDNYFDLYPDESRAVLLKFEHPVTQKQVRTALRSHSLVDTYT